MATRPKLDSDNRAVRVIERWKRGATATILVGMGFIPGAVAGAAAYAACELAGRSDLASLAGLFAFLIVGPWALGNRAALRTMGELAEVRDD